MTEMWQRAEAYDRQREREFRSFISQNADRIADAIDCLRKAQDHIARSWGRNSDYWRKIDEVAEELQADLDDCFESEPG